MKKDKCRCGSNFRTDGMHQNEFCEKCFKTKPDIAKEYAKIDIIEGVYGLSLYINDFRVVGQKPWGGGKVVKSWENVDVKDILKALDENRLPLKMEKGNNKPEGIDFFDKNDNG